MKAAKWSPGLSVLLAGLLVVCNVSNAQTLATRQIPSGEKTKIKGTIASRNGDIITIKDKKSKELVNIALFENTKIERKAGKFIFVRHPRMDVTAMLPGLTIEAEGVGNANGQLDAKKVLFSPDEFAIAIAAQQQIIANQTAVQHAQSTADEGVEAAKVAQTSANQAESSADQAQSSADQAQITAERAAGRAGVATEIGMIDAEAIQIVNNRVSDLDNYKVIDEGMIYFGDGQASLDDAAKQELSRIARVAGSTDGYMIEIAGYASEPGSKQLNQKLSEERAAAVADYLRENGNIPMRRMLAPAGYGKTRAVASEADRQDQKLDRRVDVKVLVNAGLTAGL